MTLSPEGQALYERLRPIVDALGELQDSVEGRQQKLAGKLRITVPPWVLNQYFLPRLNTFKERHPKLQLEFIATDIQRDISYEGIDVAIRVGQLADSQLLARKLAHDERILCASPKYLAQTGEIHSLDDLQTRHSVCLPWLRQWQLRDNDGQRITVKNPYCTLVSTAESVTEALKHGIGIGIKSRLAVNNYLDTGELVEVLQGALLEAQAPIWFVRPNSRLGSRKVEAFYEFCQSAFSAAMPKNS